MTRASVQDLLVGLFVLGGIGAVAYLSFSVAGPSVGGPHGLTLYAAFDQTGGLKIRAPIMIAGVKVGQIRGITLDDRFRARVQMDLDPALKLPVDTSASIVTAGILGDRYISLQLGGDPEVLKPGEAGRNDNPGRLTFMIRYRTQAQCSQLRGQKPIRQASQEAADDPIGSGDYQLLPGALPRNVVALPDPHEHVPSRLRRNAKAAALGWTVAGGAG